MGYAPASPVGDPSVYTGVLEAHRTTGRETDSGQVLF